MMEFTTTKLNETTVLFEKEFKASAERVFKMFSVGEHLKKWWAPNGFEMGISQMDFRENGTWFYSMECVDKSMGEFYGTKSFGKAIYSKIVESKNINYVHYFSDEAGTTEGMPHQTLEAIFTEAGGITKVSYKTIFTSEQECSQIAPFMEPGLKQAFEHLTDLLK